MNIKKLNNGLTIVTEQVTKLPRVNLCMDFTVSLKNEREYLGSSITHLIEHSIFNSELQLPGVGAFSLSAGKNIYGNFFGKTTWDNCFISAEIHKSFLPLLIKVCNLIIGEHKFTQNEVILSKNQIKREIVHRNNKPELILFNMFKKNVSPVIHTVSRFLEKSPLSQN